MRPFNRQATFSLSVIVVLPTVIFAFEKIDFCATSLNPWNEAKAMKLATTLVLSCKEEFLRINLPASSGITETSRLCAGARICYASLEGEKIGAPVFQDKLYACLNNLGTAVTKANPDLEIRNKFRWSELMKLVH
ncbi:uncharacterized protein LOC142803526 isoform X2 [Rhipicephalus microplus]